MEDSSIGSNIRETISENKGKLIFLLVCIILSIVIGMFTNTNKSSNNNEVKKVDLEEATIQLAKQYYEKALYPYLEKEVSDYGVYLKSHSEDGIEITLRQLVSTVEDVNMDMYNNDKYSCSFVGTTINFYPKAEYSSTDYDVKVNLSCEDITTDGGNN